MALLWQSLIYPDYVHTSAKFDITRFTATRIDAHCNKQLRQAVTPLSTARHIGTLMGTCKAGLPKAEAFAASNQQYVPSSRQSRNQDSCQLAD